MDAHLLFHLQPLKRGMDTHIHHLNRERRFHIHPLELVQNRILYIVLYLKLFLYYRRFIVAPHYAIRCHCLCFYNIFCYILLDDRVAL